MSPRISDGNMANSGARARGNLGELQRYSAISDQCDSWLPVIAGTHVAG